jgi:hypothetical protein
MTRPVRQDDERPGPEPLRPDLSDQLSPNRALRESLGASGSQRVGNNGPLANPVVSFPDAPRETTAGDRDD